MSDEGIRGRGPNKRRAIGSDLPMDAKLEYADTIAEAREQLISAYAE